MLQCILIDDELHCRESMEILLDKYCPEVNLLTTCSNGPEGILAIQTHRPDLVFLDIAMPKMNGFQMLEKLEFREFRVVFTTAYNEYAIEAFRVHAIDYLLKPIDRKELRIAVERAVEWQQLKKADASGMQISEIIHRFASHAGHAHISIPTSNGLERLEVNEILYCLSDGNYCVVHLAGGQKRLLSKNLKYIEEKLSDHTAFFRVHHTAIINLDYVREYIRGKGGYLIMQDGRSINVSRQRKKALIEALG